MINLGVLGEIVNGREISPLAVDRATYLDERVRRADRNELIDVAFPLHQRLLERNFNIAILAVGSSVFDAYHWEVREGRSALGRLFGRRGRRQYADIDLRLIPDINYNWVERQRDLRAAVQDILSERYVMENHTSAAGSPTKGPFSLRTHLSSGTQLDLLIGYGGESFKTGELDGEPPRIAIGHQTKVFPDFPYSILYNAVPRPLSRETLYYRWK